MTFKEGRVLIGIVSLFLLCCVYIGFSVERDYQYQAYADCFARQQESNGTDNSNWYKICNIILTHQQSFPYAVVE